MAQTAAGILKVPTGLIGCEVWRVAFDFQVRLTLVARAPAEGYRVDAELVIETPFLLRDGAGEWHELDPGTMDTLAPALRLFMKKINALEVSERGGLSIEFEDGTGLLVEPDMAYESWSLSGQGLEPVAVGPGGHAEWRR